MASKVYKINPITAWHQLRSSVATSDSALTTFDFASWPTSGVFDISKRLGQVSNLRVAFFGTDAANEAGTFILYGRQVNGPLQKLIAGAITLGTRVITKHPLTGVAGTAYWADTITGATGLLTASDVLLDAAGADTMGIIEIPRGPIKELYCETALSTAATIESIITGY